MLRRRLVLPGAALVLLSGSFLTIFWLLPVAEKQASSVFSTSLSEFQAVHQQPADVSVVVSDTKDGFRDVVCGGCYHAVAIPDQNIRCGLLIHDLMKKESISLADAASQIASHQEYQEACARCRPDACTPKEKIYWRYDADHRIVPRILASHVPTLKSIPSSSVVPADAMQNLTAFFMSANQKSTSLSRFLFHYNPSIVAVPPLFFEKTQFSREEDVPVYVASFRVSTQQTCFYPKENLALYGGSWDRKPPTQDYLGLALLRSDLSVVEDVVVDIKASGVFQHFAEDFRLFVFGDDLYVASFDLIAPIYITVQNNDNLLPQSPRDGYLALENVFPSKLNVFMRQFPSCPVCHNRPGNRCGGKNFNYFMEDGNSGNVLVEMWPSGPHIVQQMNLNEPCSVTRNIEESTASSTGHQTFSDAGSNPATTSWHTMEETMFPWMGPSELLLVRGRGGACCISMDDPHTGNTVLVGIFHTKVPKLGRGNRKQRLPQWERSGRNASKILPNQYLSRWYAFLPSEPYSVVAQSGLFCLGFPSSLQERAQQPLINATTWKTIVFGDDALQQGRDDSLFLNCPRIHFVSGIADKATDPSRVLVAYGINDCFPRMIEMEKEEISRLLFDGPS